MPADYPPPGTRVRWRSQGGGKWSTREGVVIELTAKEARTLQSTQRTFRPSEAFGAWVWDRRRDDLKQLFVAGDDGRYYHPRPEWLEIIEEASDGC